VEILNEVRCRHGFRLIGYVVMPEHVHLLVSEAGRKNPSKILQVLKQKVARALLKPNHQHTTVVTTRRRPDGRSAFLAEAIS
jgi:REP element-mobilizing transposase RayT